MSTLREVSVPVVRLLLACFTHVTAPLVIGAMALPPYWLALPVLVATWVSCTAQGFTGPKLVALVTLSNASLIGALYGASYLFASFLLAGGVS